MSYLPEYKVPLDIVGTIVNDPLTLLSSYVPMKILATKQGVLKKLNQDGFGSFINFELATGVNPYLDNTQNGAGLVLRKRLNDIVQFGDELCIVYAKESYLEKYQDCIQDLVRDCFVIQ